jgi:hypothetical protein
MLIQGMHTSLAIKGLQVYLIASALGLGYFELPRWDAYVMVLLRTIFEQPH